MNLMDLTNKMLEVAVEQKAKITVEFEDGTRLVAYGSGVIKARDDAAQEELRIRSRNERQGQSIFIAVHPKS